MSVIPTIAFIGVLISCDIFDKKSDFALLLLSASSKPRIYLFPISNNLETNISAYIRSATEEALGDVQSTINTINEAISDLNANITTLNQSLAAEISNRKAADNIINTNIANINSTISSLTSTVNTKASNTDVSNLQSTVTSVQNRVTALENKIPPHSINDYGKVLYVMNDGSLGWVYASTGGGGGTKETVDANITITWYPNTFNPSIEINSNTQPISGINIRGSVNREYVAPGTALDITLNGNLAGTVADDVINTPITDYITSLSMPNTYRFTFSGTPKPEGPMYKYTVDPKTLTLEVYQPTLFGTENNLARYKGQTGQFSVSSLTSGDIVYLYTKDPISSIKMSGFDYDYDDEGIVALEINGVQDVIYHKYNLHSVYETSLSVTIN